MSKSHIRLGAAIGATLFAASLLAPAAAYASSDAPTPPPDEAQVTLRAATPADTPVIPDPGETIVLTDEDGTVTTVTSLSAACTVTMSAEKPELQSAPRRVVATVSMAVESGCTDDKAFVGKIEARSDMGGWYEKSNTVGPTVSPGGYGSINVYYDCPGTGYQQLRAAAFNTPSGVGSPTAYSRDGAYPCG
ncbi:hypothetical protein K8F61_10235 [Microbacterium resistens]|uniref:Secreted protein n=1 Tax=Microbacterium resistens TaxID=156977 RepID=A0ABY3RMM7_9MICO|nr:hypothetical protein [Microbacterium resistens]UGS25083.1 hypothetical protein K8F61_10235 [Microbacterium resistens]